MQDGDTGHLVRLKGTGDGQHKPEVDLGSEWSYLNRKLKRNTEENALTKSKGKDEVSRRA